jgi:hypothetical protein
MQYVRGFLIVMKMTVRQPLSFFVRRPIGSHVFPLTSDFAVFFLVSIQAIPANAGFAAAVCRNPVP